MVKFSEFIKPIVIEVSLKEYKESLEKEIFDNLLDENKRQEFILSHLFEIDLEKDNPIILECKSSLYGNKIEFSKEIANKFFENSIKETEKNVKKITNIIEYAINDIKWNKSSVYLEFLKTKNSLISEECIVNIGQKMDFLLKKTPIKLEIFNIEHELQTSKVQQDFYNLSKYLENLNLKDIRKICEKNR